MNCDDLVILLSVYETGKNFIAIVQPLRVAKRLLPRLQGYRYAKQRSAHEHWFWLDRLVRQVQVARRQY